MISYEFTPPVKLMYYYAKPDKDWFAFIFI